MAARDFTGRQAGHYLLFSRLGSGASGSVYRAIDITSRTSPTYAIKCMLKSGNPARRIQQDAEITNHDAVAKCPHILTLCDFFEENDYIFLVLPLCEMDMERAMFRKKIYWRNESLIKSVYIDLVDGVLACHMKGVFHRDLKPENIMCSAGGTKIKIADFGLSTTRRTCRDGGCGTVPYMSPECLDENALGYDANLADIWSLGVILFNMVTLRFPWEEARPMDEGYMKFRYDTDNFMRSFQVSEPLGVLLRRIWHPTPMKRIPIPAIRQAILEMDTFYTPARSARGTSPLSKEVALIDSEKTCVAPVSDEKKKGLDNSVDVLEEAFCRLEVMVQNLVQ